MSYFFQFARDRRTQHDESLNTWGIIHPSVDGRIGGIKGASKQPVLPLSHVMVSTINLKIIAIYTLEYPSIKPLIIIQWRNSGLQ